jgi:hypothetical protein
MISSAARSSLSGSSATKPGVAGSKTDLISSANVQNEPNLDGSPQ